ncbi:MAG: PQQ-dependent sugar dehydrogenase [Bacteroidota bacterium]
MRFIPICLLLWPLWPLWPLWLWAQPNVTLTQVASGISNPVDIAHAGDDRLFLVNQNGNIRILDGNGSLLSTPFFTRNVTSGGERGLLGLAFDPDYTTNGYFYVYYSLGSTSYISRYSVDPNNPNRADLNSEQVIMTVSQPYSNHNGGDIAFGKDGYLYIGLGDGGSGGDPGNRSQNPQDLLGKMLRIDVSTLPYTIPSDNPFVNDPTTLDEIWAIGLRNPWRWSFDKETGDMWIGDVGQGAREEIHYTAYDTVGGTNYGWRCYEGNVSYQLSGCQSVSNYEFPIYDYPRGVGKSVTGGFVYRGERSPSLEGIYIFGDYQSGRLFGTRKSVANPGSWITQELLNTTHQWSTFGEDAQGEVYGADYNSGIIYRIDGPCGPLEVTPTITATTCTAAQNGAISLNISGANGASNVQWSTGDTTFSIANLSAGTYTYTVTDNLGCERTKSLTVAEELLAAPSVQTLGGLDICSGDSVTFLLDGAPAGYTIQWYKDGQPIMGAVGDSLFVTTSGDYQAAFEGVCNIPLSTVRTVTVNASLPAPVLSTGDTLNFCQGDPVTLVSPTAPQNYTYQWYKDGQPIMGATLDSLDVTASGDYSVQMVGFCTSPISDPQSVVRRALPTPTITVDSVTMELVSTPAATYQWLLFGEVIEDATGPTLAVSSPGFYSVQVVDIYGCEGTSSFYVVPVSIEASWLEKGTFDLIPNPARDQVRVEFNLLQASPLNIRIIDLQGRVLAAQSIQGKVGKIAHTFEIGRLAAGIYSIQVEGTDFQHVEPLAIIR